MKGRVLILGNAPNGAPAAALLVDGRLEDYLQASHDTDPTPAPGQIFVGQVARSGGKGAGAFVTLAHGQQGFLRDGSGLKEGRRFLVQVQGYAEPGKAPPVTRRILYKGFHLIHSPGAPGLNVSRQIRDAEERERLEDALRAAADPYFAAAERGVPDASDTATPAERRHRTAARMGAMLEDGGFIIRSAAEGAPAEELAAEFEALLAKRLAAEEALTDEAADLKEPLPIAMAEALREWTRPLPSAVIVADGSPLATGFEPAASAPMIPAAIEQRMRIEKGHPFDRFGVLEALEALDAASCPLPSGGSLVIEPATALTAVDVNTGGDFSPAAGLKANIEAARDLPRQLRLRGLGGQIVIDFAPMAKKDRRIVESTLKAALKRDPVETIAHGWTTMGLFELQRRRERRPLSEMR